MWAVPLANHPFDVDWFWRSFTGEGTSTKDNWKGSTKDLGIELLRESSFLAGANE